MSLSSTRILCGLVGLLIGLVAFAGNALGAATITLNRAPAPPQAALNNGGHQVTYNYAINFDSIAEEYTVEILNPAGATIRMQSYPILGVASPVAGNGSFTVPAGSVAGHWSVRVRYYSTTQLEQTARVTFLVSDAVGAMNLIKYEDLNGNGQRDVGEPGVAGWPITIVGPSGLNATTRSFQTGADGSVVVPNLLIGSYQVQEGNRAGWIPLGPTTRPSVLTAGALNTVAFGNVRRGALCGMAYRDDNDNGVRDAGENTPLAGVGMTLGGAAEATTTTGADGAYCFEGLMPGRYQVTAADAPGFFHSGDADGPANGRNLITPIDVPSGVRITDRDFGYRMPAAVCGVAYRDDNENGQRDPQETTVLSGVHIALSGTSGAGAHTDTNGAYCFEGLMPGIYHLNAGDAAGLTPSGDADGPDNGRSTIGPLALTPGARIINQDFGYRPPATVLRLTKTAKPKRVRAGKVARFTMKVTNRGPSVARDVVISDPIPAGVSVASLGKGRLVRGQIVWRLGNLPVGASKKVTFTVRTDRSPKKRVVRNVAFADASNAKRVRATAKLTVLKMPTPRLHIPVTG